MLASFSLSSSLPSASMARRLASAAFTRLTAASRSFLVASSAFSASLTASSESKRCSRIPQTES